MNSTQLNQIFQTLSFERMQTYENKTKTREQAVKLYLWNAQISGAFLFPLHICEVTIRNAIAEILYTQYGSNWVNNHMFINSLPNHPKPKYNQRTDLDKATKQHTLNYIPKIIPELNFVFWQAMLTQRHDTRLWNSQFQLIFPHANLSRSVQKNREHLHNDLDIVRRLRNRIAHHEPIFDEKLLSIYNKIIKIIGYRCQETANWVASHQTVTTLIAQKPKI